jgi:hypothetical protein
MGMASRTATSRRAAFAAAARRTARGMGRAIRARPTALALVAALALAGALRGANEATLAVVAEAAIEGERGLRVALDGRAGAGQQAFLVDETPAGETRYRAVFWLDPRELTMAGGNSFVLFDGIVRNVWPKGPAQVPAFRVHLRKPSRAAGFRIVGDVFAENRSRSSTPALEIAAAGPQRVQVEWRAASGAGASDGLLRLTLLGTGSRSATATGVANAAYRLLTVRLGAVGEVDSGTRGAFFLDGFESHRTLAP